MNLKRKLLVPIAAFLLLLIFLVPPAFAYPDGLLNGKKLNAGLNENNITSTTSKVTDNNETSAFSMLGKGTNSSVLWYEFPAPATVYSTQYFISTNGINLLLLDDSGKVLLTRTITGTQKRIVDSFSPVSNVKKVVLQQTTLQSATVYEFDVFGTGGVYIPPPPAPTGLVATEGDKQVDLTWSPVSGSTGYNVYQNGVKQNSSPITIESYKASGLTNGVSYSFQVSAIGSGGESAKSVAINATPTLPPPPTTPQNVSVNSGDKSAGISWSAVSGATGYNVYRDGVKQTATPITANSYTQTGLVNGTSYQYQVTAVNSYGESSKSAAVTITPFVPPPDPPRNFIAQPGDTLVNLSWDAPQGSAVSGYIIYQDGTKITQSPITKTNTVVTGLQNKRTYVFQVSAVNAGGESDKVAAGAIPDNPPPPSAPIGLAATPNNKKVSLNWTANTENNIRGYYVYQDGNLITASPVAATTYIINGLQNDKTYKYQVSAINTRNQESAKSQVVQAKPIGTTPQNVTAKAGDARVLLAWEPVAGASEYRIYRDGVLIKVVNDLKYTDEGLTNNTTYKYEVTSFVSGTESGKSDMVKARPGQFVDLDGAGGSSIDIHEIVQTGLNYLTKYWPYLVVVLAVLFAPVIISLPVWLFRKIQPKQSVDDNRRSGTISPEKKKSARTPLTPEEKEKRARERKLNKARDEKYEYLTRSGRIKERDAWVKESKYLRPEERQAKAREERNRKAREQRAAAQKSGGRRSRTQRTSRTGRGARGR